MSRDEASKVFLYHYSYKDSTLDIAFIGHFATEALITNILQHFITAGSKHRYLIVTRLKYIIPLHRLFSWKVALSRYPAKITLMCLHEHMWRQKSMESKSRLLIALIVIRNSAFYCDRNFWNLLEYTKSMVSKLLIALIVIRNSAFFDRNFWHFSFWK